MFGAPYMGWPLEWTEIIVIFIPIFLPLLKTFQIDPIIFGVMVAVHLQIPRSCRHLLPWRLFTSKASLHRT